MVKPVFCSQFTGQVEIFAIILTNLALAIVAHEVAHSAGKSAFKPAIRGLPVVFREAHRMWFGGKTSSDAAFRSGGFSRAQKHCSLGDS